MKSKAECKVNLKSVLIHMVHSRRKETYWVSEVRGFLRLMKCTHENMHEHDVLVQQFLSYCISRYIYALCKWLCHVGSDLCGQVSHSLRLPDGTGRPLIVFSYLRVKSLRCLKLTRQLFLSKVITASKMPYFKNQYDLLAKCYPAAHYRSHFMSCHKCVIALVSLV